MALRQRKWLGLADAPAYLTTLGHTGHVIGHASDSRKMTFMVRYMEHLSLVQESEVLVVAMQTYDLPLRLSLFQCRNPDVNWHFGRHLAMSTPGRVDVVAVDQIHHQEYPANVPGPTAMRMHVLNRSAVSQIFNYSEQLPLTIY